LVAFLESRRPRVVGWQYLASAQHADDGPGCVTGRITHLGRAHRPFKQIEAAATIPQIGDHLRRGRPWTVWHILAMLRTP